MRTRTDKGKPVQSEGRRPESKESQLAGLLILLTLLAGLAIYRAW